MSDNSQETHIVVNPDVDLDLANFNHLVPRESEAGGHFDGFMRQMAQKLTRNLPDPRNLLKKYQLGFYLQDREDSSPARICSSEYRMDAADLSGDSFIVMFNRAKLNSLKTEDEQAFILGHELSHLGWYHNDEEIRRLSSNEEVACDINSMKMMHQGGYDVNVVADMDQNAPMTEEWRQRREQRRQTALEMFSVTKPTPLDKRRWQNARFVEWIHDFKIPDVNVSENDAIVAMCDNLQKVYTKGGGDQCIQIVKDCVQAKGGEQGSKFFLRLAAEAMQKFPPVDKIKPQTDYRVQLRHPVNVLGNVVPAVAAMPGNKFYPPEACSQINAYFKDNPNYYRKMKVFWDRVIRPQMQQTTPQQQRD